MKNFSLGVKQQSLIYTSALHFPTNTLGNITLILRQPVFDFTPYCCACDAANINFIVFSFT
jgi:hypothetical protein